MGGVWSGTVGSSAGAGGRSAAVDGRRGCGCSAADQSVAAGPVRVGSVDGDDEFAPDVPGVADLLGRGGLVERVGGDGGDEFAGRGLLGQGGQVDGRLLRGTAGEGDAELARAEVGDGDDAV